MEITVRNLNYDEWDEFWKALPPEGAQSAPELPPPGLCMNNESSAAPRNVTEHIININLGI